jgi:glucose 1-dehydrogenase
MPIAVMDMAGFDRVWHVKVRAPVELVHRLLPLIRAAPGASVINVTSIHDVVPYAQNSAYCASKAALAMFTRTIAIELGPEGIRVNNLAPGAVETDINREVLDQIGREQFREWIPLGRVAQTSEMVGPALFLASDASRYVTGATLYADGGYMQHLVRYRPEP